MKRNKYIKHLMALGIQRNDAAGFVSTYRHLIAAGKEQLLPAIIRPIPQVPQFRTDYRVQEFAANIRVSDMSAFQRVDDLCEQRVYKELAREMGRALLDAGAIKTTVRELPPSSWSSGRCVEYRATVKVAMEV